MYIRLFLLLRCVVVLLCPDIRCCNPFQYRWNWNWDPCHQISLSYFGFILLIFKRNSILRLRWASSIEFYANMMESHGGTHKRLISSLRCKFVVLMHEIVVASILLGLGQDWCNPSLTVSENSYNPASSCWDLHLKLRDDISLQTLPRRQSALQRMFSTTKKSSPSFMTITHWAVYCIISIRRAAPSLRI